MSGERLQECEGPLLVRIGVLAICLALPYSAFGDIPTHCDRALAERSTGDDISRYQERLVDHRCEGRYTRLDAQDQIRIVSLTSGALRSSGAPNYIAWSPTDSSIHLRAHVISSRLHYQMDQEVLAGVHTYAWPTDVMGSLALIADRERIALLAWRTKPGAGETVDHIPITVGPTKGPLMLGLITTLSLKDTSVTLTRIIGTGEVGQPKSPNGTARQTFVEIELPTLTSGRYRIVVSGHTRDNTPVSAAPFYVLVP